MDESISDEQPKGKRIFVREGATHEVPVQKRSVLELDSRKSDSKHAALADLYRTDDDHDHHDMKRFSQHPKAKIPRRWIVAIIAVILVGIAVAGYVWVGGPPEDASTSDIQLTLESPAQVTSGEAFDVVLTYTNNDTVALTNIAVTFRLPSGYTLQTSDPASTSPLTWRVPDLAPGASARIRLHGDLIGEEGATAEWSASFSYMPQNFSSTFSKPSSTTSVIGDSILEVSVATPLRAVPNSPFDYELTVTNNAERRLDDLRIELNAPDDFRSSNWEPEAFDEAKLIWEIDNLEPSQTATVKFRGTFASSDGDSRELRAVALLKGEDGQYKKQSEFASLFFLVKPDLELSLTSDGSATTSVDLNEEKTFVLSYNNTSEVVYLDVALNVEIQDGFSVMDLSSFSDDKGGTLLDRQLLWTKQGDPELARIEPGKSGSVTFKLRTVNSLPVEESVTNVSATMIPRVTAGSVVDIEGYTFTKDGSPMTMKISTTAGIQAEGRYYDENLQPVGSGPLPPTVGKTTTYQIVWRLSNTLNPYQNVTVTATLPDNVTWKSNATVTHGNQLTYDDATRTVTWTLAQVGAYAGLLRSGPEATFDVSITPRESEVGTIPKLTSKTTFAASDTFATKNFTLTDSALTTELENDPGASGKSKVISD